MKICTCECENCINEDHGHCEQECTDVRDEDLVEMEDR